MSTSNFPSSDLVTKLTDINAAALRNNGDLASLWMEFRNAISEPPDLVSRQLQGNTNWETAIKDFLTAWVCPASSKALATREAAIRLLGRVGHEKTYAPYVFEKLLALAVDKKVKTDLRTWALYALYHCNLIVHNKDYGSLTQLYSGNGEPPCDEIRYWSIYALGRMARECETVTCWDKSREAASPLRCRLAPELLREGKVEDFLLASWEHETDVDVRARLITALGWVAGWSDLPEAASPSWRIVEVLKESAASNYQRVPTPVPWAIMQIAANTLHSQSQAPGHTQAQLVAIDQLLDLAICLIENCPPLKDSEGTYQYDEEYARQREYLLAIRDLARMAIREEALVPLAERVVSKCVERLLHVANLTSSRPPREFHRLRWLALVYTNDLAKGEPGVKGATEWLSRCALPDYKRMLSDEDPEIVRTVVSNMVTLMGQRDAADYFVSVILDRESKEVEGAIAHFVQINGTELTIEQQATLSQRVRRTAAQALGTIPDNSAAHDRLVDSLRSESVVGSWARDALLAMGGQKAIDSIVQYSLQKMVEEKFFAPMEEAREKGWQLLESVRWWANSNYQFAYKAALATLGIGLILLAIVAYYLLNPATAQQNIYWLLGSGLLTTAAGMVGAFFWEPAKGLNKVVSEMTRLIMSFENYLGRMRLIGLGFAHAYTTANWSQLEFLEGVSLLSGEAMHVSAQAMKDLGDWPDMQRSFGKPFAVVPSLLDRTLDEARQLLEAADLQLDVERPQYDNTRAERTVVSQVPEAATYAAKGAVVKVIPSTTQQPTVRVPDFKGKTIIEALNLARDAKLTVLKIGFEFGAAREGEVIKQDLRADLTVAEGASIELTVSKENAPT